MSLSLDEAERFGEAVLEFVGQTWCPDCAEWVPRSGWSIRCRGGHIVLLS